MPELLVKDVVFINVRFTKLGSAVPNDCSRMLDSGTSVPGAAWIGTASD